MLQSHNQVIFCFSCGIEAASGDDVVMPVRAGGAFVPFSPVKAQRELISLGVLYTDPRLGILTPLLVRTIREELRARPITSNNRFTTTCPACQGVSLERSGPQLSYNCTRCGFDTSAALLSSYQSGSMAERAAITSARIIELQASMDANTIEGDLLQAGDFNISWRRR